ncbi:unnamed protein product [Nippostrongylus brasiliensis]|uniref:HTH iclR-type domain-containing protein n=1 Tax=Nippostrongylus brasiliensis TaxID=27835 RepID=A0A0N4YTK7_NIPBR|nr:unnamed protein product [Nippostrongylus brasiliensis]
MKLKPDAPSTATVYCWFVRFAKGYFSLDEAVETRRRASTETVVVLAAVESDPTKSVRDVEMEIGIPKSTVHRVLKRNGLVSKRPRTIRGPL